MLNLTEHKLIKLTWHRGFSAASVLFVLVFALSCVAQQPLSDGDSKGTIFLNDGGFIQFNAADPAINFGYIYETSSPRAAHKHDLIFGINAKAKLSDKQGSILGNNKVAVDAGFALSIGGKYLFAKKLDTNAVRINSLFVVAMQRDLQKSGTISPDTELPTPDELASLLEPLKATVPAGSPILVTISQDIQRMRKPTLANYLAAVNDYCLIAHKIDSFCALKGADTNIFEMRKFRDYRNFDRLVFQVGYNFSQYNLFDPALAFDDQLSKKSFHNPSAQLLYNYQWSGNKLLGVGVGVERANNSDDLTQIDVRDFMSTINGGTTREFGRTKKALQGDFKQYTRAFLNADFAYFPSKLKGLFGINFFERSTLTGENKGIRPGIGIFVSQKGSPTKVIGGVSVSMDEKRHANISLIAGYNF